MTEIVHPFLRPAVSAAVETAVVETKGAPTAPTTAELQALIAQHATLINQQSTVIQQQQAAIAAFPQLLADAIGLNNTQFVTPGLTALAATIAGKAAAADVTALQGLVNTNTANIAAATTALADKAAASDLAALATIVNGKATAAALSDLATTVAGKALTSDLATTNNNVAANTTAINLRATTASVTALQNTVTQNTADIAARATTAALAAQTGRIDGLLNTTVPGLQTDIGNRLRKDAADATPFPLGVPAAPSMDKAVQKSELAGGIQRPYRVYQNVGSTPVSAYLRGTQQAAIVDALGLQQVYVLTTVRIKTISAPTLASTISLYKNGGSTAIFSQVVALANIPAVGKVLDILTLSTSLPADITLPATITASSSNGTFEIIIDGVLK